MKKDQRSKKKLTPKDHERMWGEDGPYSQVRLCEETRILDDSVSRVFLVVEAEINPFTFEYIQKHRKQFAQDEPVLQLLDHAEYREKFGYVVSAGEVEMEDEDSVRFARKQADMTIQTLTRMHAFVMDEYGLRQDDKYGIVEEKTPRDEHLVWNEEEEKVEGIGDGLWDEKTLVGTPAGVRNNKMRCFIIFAFEKNFEFKKEAATLFAKTLKISSASFQVEIENVEAFQEYILVTALLPFDIAPGDFIEAIIDTCNVGRKSIFQKDHFISNVKKPTQEQIMSFLAQLPLSKGIRMLP
ncbi:hypothetical protein L0Y69_01225 [bacterium]|nr:hypothetical protein [bacterium]